MQITLLRYYILPIDTTVPDPLIGKISEEDQEAEKYMVTTYNTSLEFQGFELFTFSDLQAYKIFKGREEAIEYYQANWS